MYQCTHEVIRGTWNMKQKTGLKRASQLITQIKKIIYNQWLYRSKLNHAGETPDNNTNELIFNDEIKDKQNRVQDTLPSRYNLYFGTPLSTILYNLITEKKNWYHSIKTA